MFRIDLDANRIAAITPKSFADLGLREREHLQEWIAHLPSALGEDLLIVEKEFAGWDHTQERLDLLALDGEGRLVIVENKLDDSGRDVIWQALKYAAYCSTLQTEEIVGMVQRHHGLASREEAAGKIAEFLADGDAEDLTLNPADSQRVVLIAASFRREVTATALWLLGKGVDVACHEVTPYQSDGALYLDIRQIIPTPETEDYMIRVKRKTLADGGGAEEGARHRRRRDYWTALLEEAAARGVRSLARRSSGKDNWMTVACGITGVQFSMVITDRDARCQFEFLTPDKALNKRLFDHAQSHADTIASAFEEEVVWRRQGEAKSSRIVVATEVDFRDRDTWPDIIDWHLTRLLTWEKAAQPILPDLARIARGEIP